MRRASSTFHGGGTDRLYTAVRAAQEETARDELTRSHSVVEDDIDMAWSVLVPSGETSVTKSELVDRLANYMPQVDLGAVTQLCGGGGLMTLDKLKSTLWKNGAPAHPINMSEEAWKLLDPYARGTVGLDTVLRMLTTIDGCEKLDPDDMRVIRLLLDLTPEDYTLSQANWEQLGSWAPKLEVLTSAQRKMLASRGLASPGRPAGAGAGRRTPQPLR
ncbi:hypothetical protein HYH02_010572 [Chlamydomonas schloesseri]|uniref:Uncharacterized protein n=1 Tax=Chlamydomonas schloesseri TaxID=2026947 RepID=A0A835W3Y7_9CHLO|nr:hypothetical protein HYH02_010572 [Chlamydomonas schloesseri]|eukprot:KAG2439692.1 hypothetical protein HYH02_010572 [Chlamydomonas schloesseri]